MVPSVVLTLQRRPQVLSVDGEAGEGPATEQVTTVPRTFFPASPVSGCFHSGKHISRAGERLEGGTYHLTHWSIPGVQQAGVNVHPLLLEPGK